MRKGDFVECIKSVDAPRAEREGWKLPKRGRVYTVVDADDLVIGDGSIVPALRLAELGNPVVDASRERLFGRAQPLRFPLSFFKPLDHARLAPLRRHLYAAGSI